MGNVAIPGNGIWIRRGCPPTASVLRFVIAPLRVGKAPLTCHCEAPQEPWQSRSTRRNTGKPRRIRRCLFEIAASGLRHPRNDTGGWHSQVCPCAPPGEAGYQICHCEAPQEPWQSRSTRSDRRKAIGESATASPRFPRRFAPQNDKLGSIARSAKPLYNLPACKALTTRKGHAASVRRQSRQRLRSERRYRRNWLVRFYRYLVRTGSAFPRLPRRLRLLAMTSRGRLPF